MTTILYAFSGEEEPARRLAAALRTSLSLVETHRFPDGEILPRITPPARTIIVYRSLNEPNEKLVELILAAEAWRRCGAERIVLVAPYLCYMRQDAPFRPGEAISQKAIAGLLDGLFDRIVTFDPHLHRVSTLRELFSRAECTHLHGADALLPFLQEEGYPNDLVVVGPDIESAPWVERIAGPLKLRSVIMTKERRGDREIVLIAPAALDLAGRPVLIVDDVCASGVTLAAAVRASKAAGASSAGVFVTHALNPDSILDELAAAGAQSMMSSDSCVHSTNKVALAPLIAEALQQEM